MVETRGKHQEKVTLAIRPRGKPVKKLPEEISVAATGPTEEIYKQIAASTGVNIHRIRITKGSDGSFIPISTSLLVDATGLRQQSTIYVKDLGPQVAWRTVFQVEYAGPLIIHPLLYLTLPAPRPSQLQTLTFTVVMVHFFKRELETVFIHRFSAATMPAFNIVRNSAYYWALSGLNMAFWVYLPSAPTARDSNPLITYTGLALFVIGELCNLSTHLTLRDLRPAGGTERGIPQGLGFNLVTCPNYMFEIVAWLGIAMISWSLSTLIFISVAVFMMCLWSRKKEAKYRKEFGSKYQKKRYSVLPGIW